MKLIVGLGNPGNNYIDSRHNIGFSVVKTLAKAYNIAFAKDSGTFSLSGAGKIQGEEVMLAIPFTFMNFSGNAVRVLFKKYNLELSGLLVVCDDVDLEFGRMKIRPNGSSGGHNGLKSVIDSLESQEFSRLRIGIGRPGEGTDTADYVLDRFTKEEKGQLDDLLKRVSDCCETWVTKGITKSMNIFNKRSEGDE